MDEISIRELTSEQYMAFLDSTTHSAFHRVVWLDAVSKVFALRIRLLGYFRSGSMLAVTPLMGRRVGPLMIWGAPLRKCATPSATVFCSPARFASELIAPLREWVAGQCLGYVQVTVPGSMELSSNIGRHTEPLDNLELDLTQPLESIWKNLSQQKTAVRNAVRAGVKVHRRFGEGILQIQSDLLQSTYGKQGLHPNIPMALYRELMRQRDKSCLHVLSASHAGKVVAAIWVLGDAQRCYYWDAAALDEARNLDANHLLVWCLIRWAYRKGFTTLDFVGTSVGGRGGSRPGIGRFKQSMGGRPVEYRLVYWYSPLMRAALAGYRLVSRLRVRLRAIWRKNHATRT